MALLAGSAAPAGAQIYAMRFKDPDDAKKFRKETIDWNGEPVILVEPRRGMELINGTWTYDQQARLEFYIQNQDDPSDLPYEVSEDGEAEARGKKLVIGIMGARFGGLAPYMPGESFYTLAKEFERRERLLESLESARDEEKKSTPAWFARHEAYAQELEMLGEWLRGTGYLRAANKLEREILRARKVADAARNERLEKALDSVAAVEPPKELNEAAERVGGEALRFKVQESMHLRVVYHDGIEDARIEGLLQLGERAIDGFRGEFVDPYLGEDFPDRVPDQLIDEFFFGTDSRTVQERMFVEYYKFGWGPRKAERLESAGTGVRRSDGSGPGWRLDYWRLDDQSDLEAILLHRLGHTLAELHFGIQGNQDWLEEGVGYYLSFAYLNRNNVTCKAFEPPKKQEGTVARGPGSKSDDDDDKTVVKLQGLREIMAETALRGGPPFPQLAKRRLYDFENADMAKSWAFFDFIARQSGKEGQIWLREVAKAANVGADSFLGKLREATEVAFGLQGQDALRVLEERWEAYLKDAYQVTGG